MKEELFVLEKGLPLDTIYEYRGATLGLRTNREIVWGQFQAYYKFPQLSSLSFVRAFLSCHCPQKKKN